PCPFDVDFGASPLECSAGFMFDVALASADVRIGPRDAPTDVIAAATKFYTRDVTDSLVVASGLGLVREVRCDDDGCRKRTLRYARLGSATYGESRVPRLVVKPDSRDGADYFPLEVGHAWEYDPGSVFFPRYRIEIIGDTLVEGRTYFVRRQWTEAASNGGPFTSTGYVRYDEMRGLPVGLDTSNPGEGDFPLSECRLDLPLYTTAFTSIQAQCACPAGESCLRSFAFSGTATVLGEDVPSKGFLNVGYGITYAVGFGEVGHAGDPDYQDRLSYARLDGVEYGEAELEYLTGVSSEEATSPIEFEVVVFPNPVADRVTLSITAPTPSQTVIEVFDVLGRRVWYDVRDSRTTAERIVLDTDAWSAGVYLLRVQAEGRTETVALTKR
ncbi:MAG: T9SS type A sorting domain-containing protein, partial [Bacteroidota bacterium]